MNGLYINDLHVEIDGKKIINGLNLKIDQGEIHVIMGPNGTGKSTLSRVLLAHPDYTIKKGVIKYKNHILNELSTDERAHLGLFLGMQMPPEIEGVTNADFLRTALHEKEGTDFKFMQFVKELNQNAERLSMNPEMIHRAINVGFSGGERKKNEILQMYTLKPSLIILDEIDSGLDVDSLKVVGENVMNYYKQYKPAILLITHYQRLLNYIQPDFVHIMKEGKIIKTSDSSLVQEIEKHGYDFYDKNGMSTVKER